MITSEMKIKMKIKIDIGVVGKVHPKVCPTEISGKQMEEQRKE